MSGSRPSRRQFVRSAAGLAVGGAFAPYWYSASSSAAEEKPVSANDRLLIGAIGLGGRGTAIARNAAKFGVVAAVCEVDSKRGEAARKNFGGQVDVYADYRELLERRDLDAVTIGTPDHWHTAIAVAALRSGKHVYCEKPLTLTIDEGKLINKVVQETGRVFQVGTQQRSEYNGMFLKAVALARSGRLGKIQRITCAIGGAPAGGPFAESDPPPELNWDMWLGQAPLVPYIKERCHYTFRWWYEYSGGRMTDWGAHHVDVAHWALGADDTGPVSVDGKGEHPDTPNGYNVATSYHVKCRFADDTELVIRDKTDEFDNGVLIEGDQGRVFVNRGKLTGKAVEQLEEEPLPEELIARLYKGKKPGNHMGNFFDCIREGGQPVSDVFSHHRAMTTCHLANISLRLGRRIEWDPKVEQIVGDSEANGMLSRVQRAPYRIEA